MFRTKTIAWQECHEFDEAINEIQQKQIDSHAKEKEIWRKIFQMGAIYVSKD